MSPRLDYRTCKACDRCADECGPLSRTRLCTECAIKREASNNLQISAGTGPFAARRERRTIMAAQRRLLAMEREGA